MRNLTLLTLFSILFYSCLNNTHFANEYYDNGDLKAKYQLLDKKKNGLGIEYYQNQKIKVESYWINDKLNGQYKTYYETGELKRITNKKNGETHGRNIEYYKNGNISEEGEFIFGKRIGEHFFYNENGLLSVKRKYIIVKNESYLNEMIYYDKEGNIINNKSNYFTAKAIKDTITYGEPFLLKIRLEAPLFDAKVAFVIGGFDSLFNIVNNELTDTFLSNSYAVTIGEKKCNIGRNAFRGYIVEYKEDSNTKEILGRNLYFDVNYFVVDSIPPADK